MEVNVGTDDDPVWKTLLAPQRFFGHVLATNEHLQAASKARPGKPLLILACHAGNPAYGHAEQAAGVLHRAGMDHDVYATVGVNRIRWDLENGSAMVSVEVPDNTALSDAITVIRASDLRLAT